MTAFEVIRSREIVMGRLAYGCDLLHELTGIAASRGIRLGRIEAIGAVQKANIGFYDQTAREYRFHEIDHPAEITKLVGNISLKDGQPFVHTHITLSDESGKAFGGHLAPGTIIFACEFLIEAFDGPAFHRETDEQTGLLLWSLQNYKIGANTQAGGTRTKERR